MKNLKSEKHIDTKLEHSTQVSGKENSDTQRDVCSGKMELNIKDIGSMVELMDMVDFYT